MSRGVTVFLLFLLSACFSYRAIPGVKAYAFGTCNRVDATTLHVTGLTDQTMLDCFEEQDLSEVETVIVSSSGGPVRPALQIAEIIASHAPHLIIERECVSSCANYFIPVASQITVRPGSAIVLHGSIDPGLVEKVQRRGSEAQIEGTQQTATLQAAFAEAHAIPKAWLLYRQSYDYGARGVVEMTGSFSPLRPYQDRITHVLVEEDFLRSCFPATQITPFQNTLIDQLDANTRTISELSRADFARTGTARCDLSASG